VQIRFSCETQNMRKHIIAVESSPPGSSEEWLNLEEIARVEVSSEDPQHAFVEKVMGKFVAVYVVIAALTSTAVSAEELSYQGWKGSVDYANGLFQGCHLDSPPPTKSDSSRIRIAANNPGRFYIVFNEEFDIPPPVGTNWEAWLSVSDQYYYENLKSNSPPEKFHFHSETPYRAVVTEIESKSGRVFIQVNADDPIFDAMSKAVELRIVYETSSSSVFVQRLNSEFPTVLDLRHFALGEPETWLNVFGTNDTYGAIKKVLTCAGEHGLTR
jgi:hypothetical protein